MKREIQKAVQAAQGYLELGMPEDAWDELESLPEPDRNEVEVLQVGVVALLRLERWDTALRLGRKLCTLEPESPSGFIHTAFCLHELGRTAEAQQLLLEGPDSLRKEATYYYNLGCYATQLGNLEEAEELLARAFLMEPMLRELAETDPDLERLRTGQ